jgi:hypothetical protein
MRTLTALALVTGGPRMSLPEFRKLGGTENAGDRADDRERTGMRLGSSYVVIG